MPEPNAAAQERMRPPISRNNRNLPEFFNIQPNQNMFSTKSITVLLADDHDVVRQGLCSLLKMNGQFTVVGEARTHVVDEKVGEWMDGLVGKFREYRVGAGRERRDVALSATKIAKFLLALLDKRPVESACGAIGVTRKLNVR